MIPQLVPVRGRNQLGLDRGVVVVAAMAVVIGVLVLRPWAAPGEVAEIAVPSADTTEAGAFPSMLALLSPVPIASEQQISLDELRSRAGIPAQPLADRGAVFGTTFDLIRIPSVAETPASTELGSDCVGGAMLGEGSDAIAVQFDHGNVTSFRVERLFDSRPAVQMPVITTEKAADGIVLTTGLETPWPVGHYALAVTIREGERVLPFCVGRQIRQVDYSLIAFVPPTADGRTARAALLAQIANL